MSFMENLQLSSRFEEFLIFIIQSGNSARPLTSTGEYTSCCLATWETQTTGSVNFRPNIYLFPADWWHERIRNALVQNKWPTDQQR